MVEFTGTALSLAIGGASSGKSRWAEAQAEATGLPRLYIATAEAHDAEMEAKIAAHKASRGDGWTTVEAPHDLASALARAPSGHVVVIDCLTLWLTNRMLAEADLAAETDALLAALAACPGPVIAVTNEVGQGIVPEHRLGRRFRTAQGALNQAVAAQADRVALVVAGLPLWLKGGP